MNQTKLYVYLGIASLVMGTIIYFLIRISNLKETINELKLEVTHHQVKYTNCVGNLNQIEKMLEKQNNELKKIERDFLKNQEELKLWKDKKQEEKYNATVNQIFNKNTTTDILNSIKDLNYKDL